MGGAALTRRLAVVSAVAVAGAVAVAAASTRPSPLQDPQQPRPVFRSGVSLVRVDVSVTGRDGRPVADLTADDFEILEDDVVQQVETVQFLRLDGQPSADFETSLAIRSREHAEAEAARENVRIFAVFLDDYHVDRRPNITIPVRRALAHFVEQLGPTDLVTVMEPLTPLSALEFTRSREVLLEKVRSFEGRRGELFPVKSVLEEAHLTQRDIGRIRAEVTLNALTALASYLGGLREGRKSILLVTQGPPVSPWRRESWSYLDEVIEAANRGNVTIHVLDPRGLGGARFGGDVVQWRLAEETGGRAIIHTNDLVGPVERVIEDASAYYLVGYTPGRDFADGRFHRIEVKVKRAGARVLARRGYWAPRAEELTDAAAAAAVPPVPGLAAAREHLSQSATGRPLDVWIGLARGRDARTRLTVSWERAVRSGTPPRPAPVLLEIEPIRRDDGTALAETQAVAGAGHRPDGPAAAVFELRPGELALRFTALGPDRSVLDRWTQPVTLPDLSHEPLALATPRLLVARSAFEARTLGADPHRAPAASRRFRRTDRLLVEVECYWTGAAVPAIAAQILNAQGQPLFDLPVPALEDGLTRVAIPLGSMAPSEYVLRVQARADERLVEELVAFRLGS